jgi:hypothetical protein
MAGASLRPRSFTRMSVDARIRTGTVAPMSRFAGRRRMAEGERPTTGNRFIGTRYSFHPSFRGAREASEPGISPHICLSFRGDARASSPESITTERRNSAGVATCVQQNSDRWLWIPGPRLARPGMTRRSSQATSHTPHAPPIPATAAATTRPMRRRMAKPARRHQENHPTAAAGRARCGPSAAHQTSSRPSCW